MVRYSVLFHGLPSFLHLIYKQIVRSTVKKQVFFMSEGWSGSALILSCICVSGVMPKQIPSCTNPATLCQADWKKLCVSGNQTDPTNFFYYFFLFFFSIELYFYLFKRRISFPTDRPNFLGIIRYRKHKLHCIAKMTNWHTHRWRMGPVLYTGPLTWEGLKSPFAFGYGNYKDVTALFSWYDSHIYRPIYLDTLRVSADYLFHPMLYLITRQMSP